jgi:formyltetrahydrofolate deformylase
MGHHQKVTLVREFEQMRRYVLTITCPDRVGIVAAVTGFIASHGGSVLEATQHGDLSSGRFFLRIEVTAESLPFGPEEFRTSFQPVATEFSMEWQITDTDVRKRVMLLVSREDHCLVDLLYRWRSGDLECDITSVVSNHEDLRSVVEWHEIPFHWIPVPSAPPEKTEAFEEIQRTFEEERADVMVLARYMQILPASLCAGLGGRIINIHHSFLPSFAGSRPYHQAFARGVKLIGATCHYVTADLDEGPIIEQDTRRIDHGDSPEELRRVGRDIERAVLARGLRWHLEDRVLLNGSKTIVFA